MAKACSLCGDELIHIAPGFFACFRDDLVAKMPIYLDVKGKP